MKKKEMIKKIREEVILANNPDCRSYEEALKKELKFGCEVYCNKTESNYTIAGQYGLSCVIPDYLMQYMITSDTNFNNPSLIHFKDGEFAFKIYNDNTRYAVTIVGLPLTLERILVAIEYKHNKIWSFQYQTNIGFYINSFSQDKIIWQPNQTLESQSIETIEKIYNILNND